MLTIVLAFAPIVLLFILMIGMKMPAIRAMPIAWALTLILAIVYWQVPAGVIAGSHIKGLATTFDIILILIGAIFMLEVLKQGGFISRINTMLRETCSDKRVGAIIIGWSFVCLIEGAAGFGTPAALAAPLIASMGINPTAAVAITLIADAPPVSFGALGTPINIGVGEAIVGVNEALLSEVVINTALIHLIVGMFIPFTMLLVLAYLEKKPLSSTFELLPFCLFAAATFLVPYFIVAIVLGQIFPSLIGGTVSLALMFIALEHGWFLPKTTKKKKSKFRDKLMIFSPYILASALLIVSKIPAISAILKSVVITGTNIFDSTISFSLTPLSNPGTIFFASALVTIAYMRIPRKKVENALSQTLNKCVKTFITLAFTICLVQTFLNSSNNLRGIESMPMTIAGFLSELFSQVYIFVAPQIGMFGSFLAGSNTVSNIFFSGFQQAAANELGLSVALILALQVVGGAAGNMIAIHNIIAASATVGLNGKEGEIIRVNIIPAIAYSIAASLIALIIMSIF